MRFISHIPTWTMIPILLALCIGCKPRDFNTHLNQSTETQSGGYRDIARASEWAGQIFLPSHETRNNGSIYLKVSHAPENHKETLGQIVKLTWPQWMGSANKFMPDVKFNSSELEQARKSKNVVPTSLDGWKKVSPLESLAAARCFGRFSQTQSVAGKAISLCDYEPLDRIFVRIKNGTFDPKNQELSISDEPILVPGTHVTLVSQIKKLKNENPQSPFERFSATQFTNGRFDESKTIEFFVENNFGTRPNFTFNDINSSPAGALGWYLYGEFDSNILNGKKVFLARAIEPRALLQTTGIFDSIEGKSAGKQFLSYQDNFLEKNEYLSKEGITQKKFANLVNNFRKLRIIPSDENSKLSSQSPIKKINYNAANSPFQLGESGLLVHLFHWITDSHGKKDVGPLGLVTGHYSYGTYEIVREPISGDLQFEVTYQQVYGQGPDGVISARTARSEYMGNFRRGWSNSIATSDVFVRTPWLSLPIDPPTGAPKAGYTPEYILNDSLALMTHAYRTGSGDGISSITAWASCVQDSSQALFIALRQTEKLLASTRGPTFCQSKNLQSMCNLLASLQRQFTAGEIFENAPVRGDWVNNALELQIRRSSNDVDNGFAALASYKTALPRNAFNLFLGTMLDQGIELLVMDNVQIGGQWTAAQRADGFIPVPATSIFDVVKSTLAKVRGSSGANPTTKEFVDFILRTEGIQRLEDLNHRYPNF